MINSDTLDKKALRTFVYSCEDESGGFSDRRGNEPDLYHLMFSLASIALIGEDKLKNIDPGFCLC